MLIKASAGCTSIFSYNSANNLTTGNLIYTVELNSNTTGDSANMFTMN